MITRYKLILLVITAVLIVTACAPQSTSTNDAEMSRLRLVNLVYGSSSTDMYVDGQIALLGSNHRELKSVQPGFVTGFLYVIPGRHSVAVVPTGQNLASAMIALDVMVQARHRYTVAVTGQKEDATFSPLVIDETQAIAKARTSSDQNIMIFVNNLASADTFDFLEDGAGPAGVPYGGYVAAPIKTGYVSQLVTKINGEPKSFDNPGNFTEPIGIDLINSDYGKFPDQIGFTEMGTMSDLGALELLKLSSDSGIVWDDATKLSYNTFLSMVEKAKFSNKLVTGTYLIFVPTDEAFEAMSVKDRETLMNDPQALTNFLNSYIVEGYYPFGSLSGMTFGNTNSTVKNLLGKELRLSEDISINGIPRGSLPGVTVANGTRLIPIEKLLPTP